MKKSKKNNLKSLFSMVLALIFVLQIGIAAYAEKAELLVPLFHQSDEEKCCWAYCGTSVCQYYGISMTVDLFILTVKGTTSRQIGGSLDEIRAGLQFKGLSCTRYDSVLSYYTSKQQINQGTPMIYNSRIYAGKDEEGRVLESPHAIMISGYNTAYSSVGEALRITDSLKPVPIYRGYYALTNSVTELNQYQLINCLYQFS